MRKRGELPFMVRFRLRHLRLFAAAISLAHFRHRLAPRRRPSSPVTANAQTVNKLSRVSQFPFSSSSSFQHPFSLPVQRPRIPPPRTPLCSKSSTSPSAHPPHSLDDALRPHLPPSNDLRRMLQPTATPSPNQPTAKPQQPPHHQYGTRIRSNSVMRPSARLRQSTDSPAPPRRIKPVPVAKGKAASPSTEPPPVDMPIFPPPHVMLHSEDANNKVLLAIGRSFVSVVRRVFVSISVKSASFTLSSQDNKAMTIKDLAEMTIKYGLMCQKCVCLSLTPDMVTHVLMYAQCIRGRPGHHHIYPQPSSTVRITGRPPSPIAPRSLWNSF